MTMQPEHTGIPEWTLGWRLQRALAQADLTSEAIADELGYSRSSVSRWMNDKGAPRPVVLREWALRCGVPYKWLATGETGDPETGPGLGITPSAWDVVADLAAARESRNRPPVPAAA